MSWFPAIVLLLAFTLESAHELNDSALVKLEEGDHDGAIELLERAVELKEEDPVLRKNLAVALNNRGLILIKKMEFGRAIHDFERAHKLVDDNPLFLIHLGYAYLKRWDIQRAEYTLIDANRRFPDDPQVLDHLGFVYYVRDRLEDAIKTWGRRLEIEEDPWARSHFEKAIREHEVSSDFIDRSSNDFTLKILGTAENVAIADEVLKILEDARAMVCGDLGFYPQQRTTVLVYSSSDEFKRATGSHAWVGGLYDGKIRLPLGDLERDRKRLERTARHEYTHRVLHELVPDCPIWLNEGLAEWFEKGGDLPHQRMIELSKDGEITPLADLPESFATQQDAAVVARQYAAAQSFVTFLMEKYGLGALRSFVLAIRRGVDLDQAFRRTYGASGVEVEARWHREALLR